MEKITRCRLGLTIGVFMSGLFMPQMWAMEAGESSDVCWKRALNAIKRGNLERLREQLNSGKVKVNKVGPKGRVLLYEAIRRNEPELAQVLIEYGASNVRTKRYAYLKVQEWGEYCKEVEEQEYFWRRAMRAVKEGNLKGLQDALSSGKVEINKLGPGGMVLAYEAIKDSPELFKELANYCVSNVESEKYGYRDLYAWAVYCNKLEGESFECASTDGGSEDSHQLQSEEPGIQTPLQSKVEIGIPESKQEKLLESRVSEETGGTVRLAEPTQEAFMSSERELLDSEQKQSESEPHVESVKLELGKPAAEPELIAEKTPAQDTRQEGIATQAHWFGCKQLALTVGFSAGTIGLGVLILQTYKRYKKQRMHSAAC